MPEISPTDPSHDAVNILTTATDFLDAVNGDDWMAAEACVAADVLILDSCAPFRWQGAGTIEPWMNIRRYESRVGRRPPTKFQFAGGHEIKVDGDGAWATLATIMSSDEGDEQGIGVLSFSLRRSRRTWLIDTVAWLTTRYEEASWPTLQ